MLRALYRVPVPVAMGGHKEAKRDQVTFHRAVFQGLLASRTNHADACMSEWHARMHAHLPAKEIAWACGACSAKARAAADALHACIHACA